ncbi:hypothetical protein HQ586_10665 [Candidatus Bathyarchaeota archaeon]|nr:hypothetical protein [Candidatus Bathyarchaeota archaeon]
MVTLDRETKVISAILFATLLSLVGAYYLDRQYFVDWSEVEKIAEYDSVAVLGDTILIKYYFVNPESHDIKVEPRNSFGLSIYYASKPDERVTANVNVNWAEKFITVPAKSTQSVHSETVTATQLGTLHVQLSGLPEVQIEVFESPDLGLLKLRLEPDEEEYRLGETANVSVYLVNPFPHPVLVETPSFFMFNGEFEDQLELFIEVVTFNPEGEPLTIEPNSEIILDTCSIKPSEQGLLTLHARLGPLSADYVVQILDSNTRKYITWSNFTVTPGTIELGEKVKISFEITNILRRAAHFGYAVTVKAPMHGDPYPSYSYSKMGGGLLEGYETRTITHVDTPATLGWYKVSVGELEAYFHVVSSIITVNGTLGSERYPVPWFGSAPPALGEKPTHRVTDVLVLETLDSKRYLLECDCRTNMLLTNSSGNYVVGGLTLDEWNDAYREGKTVEIEGYVRVETIDDVEYLLLHILTARNAP